MNLFKLAPIKFIACIILFQHIALLPVQSYVFSSLRRGASPFKVEVNPIPTVVDQAKKSVKNAALRNQFLNTYGRHISLVIDEIDQELINENEKYAVAGAQISTLLKERAGLILTNITVWYHALTTQDITLDQMKQWNVYTNNTSLLLVPKVLQTYAGYSDYETGLDLTHFKLIPDPTMMYDSYNLETLHECLLPLRELCASITNTTHVVDSFKLLMVSKHQDEMKDKAPWSVCIDGHGNSFDDLSESSICGMMAYQFKEFLHYLETYIVTKMVVYHSCHAGSKKNLVDLYDNYGSPLVYSFPIICSSFSNGVASVYLDKERKGLRDCELKKFLQAIKNVPIVAQNAQKIFNAIGYIHYPILENYPHVRWAGDDHFQLFILKDSAAAYILLDNESEPSQINYILNKPIIDDVLVFDNKESFTFVESGRPDCTHHYIKKIHLPKSKGFDDLFAHFLYIVSKEYRNKDPKVYLIDTATCAKNKSASNIIIYLRRSSDDAWNAEQEYEMLFEQAGSCYAAHVTNAHICLGDEKNNIYPAIKIEKLSELEAQNHRKVFARAKQELLG
ncbi:MAG: hypothetical protein P4L31_05565 [Candidatus Babeliales bacterium]|nr:hypothetical protein [Candidatus Babeliales bacterium]